MYRSFRTPLYVPYLSFILQHCLAHSVRVCNPSCLAQSRQRNDKAPPNHSTPFPLFCFRASRHSSRLSDITQAARTEPSRVPSAYTHTLSLFSFPAGGRAINNRQSAIPYSILSIPSFRTHTCGPSVCHTMTESGWRASSQPESVMTRLLMTRLRLNVPYCHSTVLYQPGTRYAWSEPPPAQAEY